MSYCASSVLVQHDQIKSEILKQNALSFLFDSCQQFSNRSKRLLLESIGSVTFDHEAARVLRDNAPFIRSVEKIQESSDDGIRKAAEKILWNLVQGLIAIERMSTLPVFFSLEPEKVAKRKKKRNIEGKQPANSTDANVDKSTFQYDIMISYCHADKEIVYRIHRVLVDRGFKIWFDRDNIYGPGR